ncbi:MAG: 50S ribosomal protein L29 [Candidatus Doudnabacteria bacterium]|nr:50S ribosomal protein L29 [Candidatus Doudnabacteria bacterium]
MTIKELRTKSEAELRKMLASMREQSRDLRFQIYSKEVKNNHQMRIIRKDIARILTLLNSSR